MTRLFVLVILGFLAGCGSPATQDTITTRTLIAASNMTHPPFSSRDADGQVVGIEVEIVEEAARELGARVEWVERPFSELLTAIEKGEIDIAVSTIGITEERKQIVAFSEPYYETQIKVEEMYQNPSKWAEFALHNIAGMSSFSGDISIENDFLHPDHFDFNFSISHY